MELTILGGVGLVAFLIAGAAVMLVASFRRTVELRGALIQAMKRIERLEAAVASGRPIATSEVPPAISTETPIPALEHAGPRIVDAPPQAEPAEDPALAQDRIEPPHLGLVAFVGILIAVASLAAAQIDALSGSAGVLLAIVAGIVVIVVAEWRRAADLRAEKEARGPWPLGSALMALFGLALMLGAILYGCLALRAVPPLFAFLGAATLSLGAAALSLRHGAWLIAAALTCGAVAPALAPLGPDAPLSRYVFLIALAGAAMVLARRNRAPAWAWVASVIALGWGVNAVIVAAAPTHMGAAGAYFVALATIGLLHAWSAAETPMAFPRFWSSAWSEPAWLAHLLGFGAAACLIALILMHIPTTGPAGASLVALAASAASAAAFRPGLWLAPFGAALAAIVALGLWPALDSGLVDAPNLVIVAAALGLVFSIGGWLMMARGGDPRAGATLAALAPIAVFVAAQTRMGAFGGASIWAALATAIAALNIVSYLQLAKSKPDAAAPFVAGAALALTAALYVLTPDPYAPLALAGALPLIALVDRWRDERGLRVAALILCGLLAGRLVAPQIFVVTAGTPALMALLFVPSALAMGLAARLFARGRARADTAAAQIPVAAGLTLLACLGTLVFRHVFTIGAISAPYASLVEMGLNTIVWLALAIVLAWRFGARPRLSLRTLEFVVLVGAATHVLIAGAILINPWWGLAPADAPGWRGLNVIALAYAAPAILLLAYAALRARQNLNLRATISASLGFVLLFLAMMLELRRLFHGAEMDSAPVLYAEAWTYSGAWIGFAAILLALSAERGGRILRTAALVLALAALLKTALFDLGAFDGLTRLLILLSLAAVGGALVFLYHRYVLSPAPAQPKTMADPNLLPPS